MCSNVRLTLLVAIFLLWTSRSTAQLWPAEGSQLHYRYIAFRLPTDAAPTEKASIEIAAGHFTDLSDFSAHIISSIPCKNRKTLGEVPSFGASYTWHIKGMKKYADRLFHFSTLSVPMVDTAITRLRIAATDSRNTYFFCDGTRVLYDSKGAPIWFLPEIPGEINSRKILYDLKMSPQHTITFMLNAHIYEIDWNGNVLWKGPDNGQVSGDSTERYHHEFTRLKNGHYLAMGNQLLTLGRNPGAVPPDGRDPLLPNGGGPRRPSPTTQCIFGTIIEYDSNGKVVWQWKTYPYFSANVLEKQPQLIRPDLTHENAVFFDEIRKFVYLSMKNVNEILKIKYPSGEVLAVYGQQMSEQLLLPDSLPFCQQHCVKVSTSGELYFFNNNMCRLNEPPNILVYAPSKQPDDQLSLRWKYKIPFDMTAQAGGVRTPGTSGGSVSEMNDGNFFISAFKPLGDMYIVTRGSKIVWHGVLETRRDTTEQWHSQEQYRASIINSETELNTMVLRGLK